MIEIERYNGFNFFAPYQKDFDSTFHQFGLGQNKLESHTYSLVFLSFTIYIYADDVKNFANEIRIFSCIPRERKMKTKRYANEQINMKT